MSTHRKLQLTFGAWLAIGLIAFVAGILSGDVVTGAVFLAFYLACCGLLEVGRRRGWSTTANLAGVGDERSRAIYRQAGSRTTDMLGVVLAVWAVVAFFRNGTIDDSLFAVIFIYSGLWVANICLSMYGAVRESETTRRTGLGL